MVTLITLRERCFSGQFLTVILKTLPERCFLVQFLIARTCVHACARGARAYACEYVSVRAGKGVRIWCA